MKNVLHDTCFSSRMQAFFFFQKIFQMLTSFIMKQIIHRYRSPVVRLPAEMVLKLCLCLFWMIIIVIAMMVVMNPGQVLVRTEFSFASTKVLCRKRYFRLKSWTAFAVFFFQDKQRNRLFLTLQKNNETKIVAMEAMKKAKSIAKILALLLQPNL